MSPRPIITLIALALTLFILYRTRWVPLARRRVDVYNAELRYDLRKLAQAQAAFFAARGHYAASLDSLPVPGFPTLALAPSADVQLVIVHADARGWEGYAAHLRIPTRCTYRDSVPPRPVPELADLVRLCVTP